MHSLSATVPVCPMIADARSRLLKLSRVSNYFAEECEVFCSSSSSSNESDLGGAITLLLQDGPAAAM